MNKSERDSQVEPGELIWEFPADNSINSSPVVADGLVYFTDRDDNLVAVDVQTGNWEWYFEMDTGVFGKCSPTVTDETIYIGSGDGCLYAISTSGEKLWEFEAEEAVKCQPVVRNDSVYFADRGGHIFSVHASSGEEEWHADLSCDQEIFKSSIDASHEAVYVGSPDNNLYALDADTGSQVWKFQTRGSTTSSPAVADDTVYIGSRDENLYAIDTETGTKKWHFKTRGNFNHSSPLISDDTVYIGNSDCCLYAIDRESGTKKWEFETENWILTPPRIDDGIVYFGSKDYNLYAVDASSGIQEWSFRTKDPLSSLSTVVDGVIYAGSQDNTLYAVKAGRKSNSISDGLQDGTILDSTPDMQSSESDDNDRISIQNLASLSGIEKKEHLQEMDPYQFEHLVADLWKFQGYETTVRQGSSDRGIDIEAERSEPFYEKLLIQAKRYSDDNKVGSEEVRNYATLYQQVPDADSVIIVTTGEVTSEAEVLSNDLDVKLVDINSLSKLINSCGK